MTKTVILSNSNLNIGLNESGLVSDFYYPDNAFENHTLGNDFFHRIGIFIDGKINWLSQKDWTFTSEYPYDSLISLTKATNNSLKIRLEFEDLVLSDKDVFLRNIHVVNLSEEDREIKIFFHQNFSISASRHFCDTVQFIPKENSILHYRADRYFLISAQVACSEKSWRNFDDYTVGLFGIENKEGSWRDAEDGILSKSNVEHGQVDSVMGLNLSLKPHESTRIQYSISCATNFSDAQRMSKSVSNEKFLSEIQKTQTWWENWLKPAQKYVNKLDQKYQKLFIKSLLLTKSHLAKSGAPIASNDSEMLNHARDDYSYCWPRDALFALWPFVRLGYKDEVQKFIKFCQKIITPEGYLMHKYLPNGELGPSWHPYAQFDGSHNLPIQTDETAGVLFLICEYLFKFHDQDFAKEIYDSLIKPMADFLSEYLMENNLPKPSYELWEMDYLTTTYTTSLTFAALSSVAEIAQNLNHAKDSYKWRMKASLIKESAQKTLFNHERGYFYRGIWPAGNFDEKIDSSSLYGAIIFGLFDINSNEVRVALKTLEDRFGANYFIGLPRFEDDVYYRDNKENLSNIWVITSLWRAEYYISYGDKEKAYEILDWVMDRASPAGILPEQINPTNNEWRSVAPLTWSQAEVLSALLDLIALEE